MVFDIFNLWGQVAAKVHSIQSILKTTYSEL